MKIVIAIIRKEITEMIRTKKAFVLLILFVFIAISSPIIAKLIPQLLTNIPGTGIILQLPDPSWKDAIDQYVKNISQIAVIAIIFIFSGIICDEKNKKTLEIILTKPIQRSQLIIGKYLAGFLLISVVSMLSGIVFYYYSMTIFGAYEMIKILFLVSGLTLFLEFIYTITFMFSSFVNNQINTAGLAFLTYILISTVFGYFEKIQIYIPTYLLSNYTKILNDGTFQDFIPSVMIMFLLIVILLLGSILIFSQQEIER